MGNYALATVLNKKAQPVQLATLMIAIVFACERFEPYVYGRDLIHVESDHKPLEAIFCKPLHSAPKRLQRMLLRLQKYSLYVAYKKGKTMFLADTLSRAFLPEVNICELTKELKEVDHRAYLPVHHERWQQMRHTSANDPVLQKLRETIRPGWPEIRSEIPDCFNPYHDMRDVLTDEDELVFKGRLIVPAALRKELMAVVHSSHIGIEGCIRRARDTLYWPRMATELREYISKCDVCQAHRTRQAKEPPLQHEVVARPWSKVTADLCDRDSRTLLVMSDYYSNYIEVARLNTATSRNVIKDMKAVFARYGIPDVLVTDNGPQFSSAEFAVFAKTWMFKHTTSSPYHPQFNGKAENAVKTVKRLFTKCKESGQSEALALVDWRNTPTEGIGLSPAQRLMGRRCKTLLPVAGTLLQPRYSTEQETRALIGNKQRQQHYYSKHAKPLHPIQPGETVRMNLPGQKTWTASRCTGQTGPRSYDVKIGETAYMRNRRQLIRSKEPPIVDISEPEPSPSSTDIPPQQEQAEQPIDQACGTTPVPQQAKQLIDQACGTTPVPQQAKQPIDQACGTTPVPQQAKQPIDQACGTTPVPQQAKQPIDQACGTTPVPQQAKQPIDQACGTTPVPQQAQLRRSQRARRPPAHLNDFVTK